MTIHRVLSVLVLTGVCGVTLAGTPETPQVVPNWEAPAFWEPPADPDRAAVSEGRAPGLHRFQTQAAVTPALPFIGITPCRVADTRGNGFTGAYGPPSIGANTTRNFAILGQCGIPASAAAVSFNFAALDVGAAGDLRVFPAGGAVPLVSTLNYNANTPNIANAAVVPLGTGGAITVQADATTINLIIDVNGYYGGLTGSGNNVFLGPLAGNLTMTGSSNTGIGLGALFDLTTGSSNTAVGTAAMVDNTQGFENTAVGVSALSGNTTGTDNTAVGKGALASNNASANTGLGWQALMNNSTGSQNVGVGGNALFNITTGSDDNIAVGYAAALGLTSGSHNIFIGNGALASESNTIRIGTGGTHTKFFVAGVRGVTTGQANGLPVLIDGAAQLGTVSSSAKVKRDIANVGVASSALLQLRPVTFFYRNDTIGIRQYGLIAEEVAEVMPELVQFSDEGEPQTVRYHFLTPLLLNELQKQQRTIERQNEVISGLEARLARLEARLAGGDGR